MHPTSNNTGAGNARTRRAPSARNPAPAGPKAPKAQRNLDRVTFGKRLRAARKGFGWTLQQVADASRISITTISRAERGELALSYERFSALARALQMDLAAMFSEAGEVSKRLDGFVVTRAGRGVTYRGEALAYEFLTTQAVGKQMSPILATIHARKISGPEDFSRHPGEEFMYILSGKVEVHFEDGRTAKLGKGDALYFDSRIGHAYISTSRQPARAIGACTSESSMMKLARERAPVASGGGRIASGTRKAVG